MTPPGSLAIEFTHTRSPEVDRLVDYAALLDWADRQGVLSSDSAHRLRTEAAAHPHRASAVHSKAVKLRDAIYRILSAGGRGETVEPEDLEELNGVLKRAAPHRELVRSPDGYEWTWEGGEADSLEAPLWRVAYAAVELLTSEWTDRVGVCAADDCHWLFVDESRNRSRRWCDMSDCGTREKVRRFRARAKRGK